MSISFISLLFSCSGSDSDSASLSSHKVLTNATQEDSWSQQELTRMEQQVHNSDALQEINEIEDAVANIDEVEEEIKKIDGALFKCYNINRLYHIQKSFNVLEEGIADKIQEKGLNPPIPEGSVGNIVLNE